MSELDLIKHLPDGWLAYGAAAVFSLYVIGQAIEKYDAIAKRIPLGRWWAERKANKVKPIDAMQVAEAVEKVRHQWETDGESALQVLEARLLSIAAVSKQQVLDIDELQDTVRAFRAWSGYDSRWHHRHDVDNANNPAHVYSTQHRDFFEYERLWRADPAAAAVLT
ncbi:hypothetical protein SEA_CHRIS_33 [Mycobacterium phage Chris]|uniref:Minor tail protein n=1 Tax=Mycobacterium phage Chris TaxID=2725626 RepID=A0A6M3SWT4_9CAUD|nr:hypothetical protein I5G96_gp072 [Mycobacterium phage Chris]QJD50435.1 hypothetical protein SEA_CHRIS_33 [Mycobacterium phage Chris]